MRRRGSSSATMYPRGVGGIALGLALLIAIPALAAASPKRSGQSRIPSCTHLSPTAIAKVLDSAPLKFKGRTGHSNLCTWEAHKRGHYHELVTIDIIPGIKSIYRQAEADGMKNAAKEGRTFGKLTLRHSPWKAAFFVYGTTFNSGLAACPPEHTLPIFGPPGCSGDPSWTLANVDSYNSSLMVSVGADAQLGDVHLSRVIELNKEILSGTIR